MHSNLHNWKTERFSSLSLAKILGKFKKKKNVTANSFSLRKKNEAINKRQ